MSHQRFQLIEPFVSNKVYETSNMLKGAKRCYKELKSSGLHMSKINEFVIRDIDHPNQSYRFKINKHQHQHGGSHQYGGFNDNIPITVEIENPNQNPNPNPNHKTLYEPTHQPTHEQNQDHEDKSYQNVIKEMEDLKKRIEEIEKQIGIECRTVKQCGPPGNTCTLL